jgi:hypothetical protein
MLDRICFAEQMRALTRGEVHVRASWIFTRTDALANLGTIPGGGLASPRNQECSPGFDCRGRNLPAGSAWQFRNHSRCGIRVTLRVVGLSIQGRGALKLHIGFSKIALFLGASIVRRNFESKPLPISPASPGKICSVWIPVLTALKHSFPICTEVLM